MENVEVRFDDEARWLSMRRGEIQVVCNLAADTQAVAIESAGATLARAADEAVQIEGNSVKLPPDSVGILVRQSAEAGVALPEESRSAAAGAHRR